MGSPCASGTVCLAWLRDDMRLHDNPALLHAAEGGFDAVVPVFVHDEREEWNPHPLRGAARCWKHESLKVFAVALTERGSRLVIRQANEGGVADELLRLCAELGAAPSASSNRPGTQASRPQCTVAFNRRCEPWHCQHDDEVSARLRAAGVAVQGFPGNVLYEPRDLQPIERWQRWRSRVREEEAISRGVKVKVSKDLEHVSGFGSYRFFSHALEELGPPSRPCPTVSRLPRCPAVASLLLEDLGMGKTAGHGFPADFRQSAAGSGEGAGVGATKQANSDWAAELRRWWSVGEAAALGRLEHFLAHTLATGDFEGRKRLHADAKNTSELSPYIRFGELSAKTVYWAAKDRKERTTQKLFSDTGYRYVGRHGQTYKGDPRESPKANATFLRRFVWRDLAYWFLWEFPSLPRVSLRPQYEEEVWAGTRAQLRRWQRGTTGFPLVDAAMRQLWAVGWMPNYLRHVVAQTLVEYLDLSWKHGLEWFDWTLVDADVAINSFMWQNGGHSGPDHWEFVLHPVNAAKSCDPDGSYVRRWLPVLADCPAEYIHRPWDLPALVLRMPLPGLYPERPILDDLDEARRAHFRRVLQVRRSHPEMISRTGHEWLKLPGRKGLLAKVVTRLEFRAETEDFLLYQGPQRRGGAGKSAAHTPPNGNDHASAILAEAIRRYETADAQGPGL